MANVTFLTDDEIDRFLNDLDHNGNGQIEYSEVEHKLDQVHDEIAPHPQPHNLNHDTKEDHARHHFLRSIIGSEKNQIPRDEFAQRVREWQIPSLKQSKKEEQNEKDYKRNMSIWRRIRSYWAVHGPEILFLALVVGMQLAFGIWQMVKYMTVTEYRAAFGWGVVLAKTCAGALYPTFFFLILSMSRYFSTFLRKWYYVSRFINWDLSQEFHIKISCVALVLATLHAIGHLTGSFVFGSQSGRQDNVAYLLGPDAVPRPYSAYAASLPGWSGIVALGLFWTLALCSIPQVRKWNYEIFQLSHLLMYPIIGLLCAHGTAALLQWPMFGYWLAFPTLLILIERLTRVAVGFHRIPATLKVLDGETVEVRAQIPSERIWKYRAGQYIFLQVPQLSPWQWHPFTVSICIGNEMAVHIKTDGNWTAALRNLAGPSGTAAIAVGVNGPFGAPAQRFHDFSHAIVVGAGIGVTPFAGILADLQARDDRLHAEKPQLEATDSGDTLAPDAFADDYRRVDFHWMVRDRNYLLWFSDLLNSVSRAQSRHTAHHPHLDIRIRTHVTQRRDDIAVHVYRWLLEKHRTDEHPESPLTGLINSTHFGRPDFVGILDQHCEDMRKFQASLVREGKEGGERLKVGVFFCGAPVIGEVLADRCRLLTARGRADGSKIEYFFMMEVFG